MIIELAFHVFAFIETSFALLYDYKYVNYPENPINWHHPFGGKFKFLTIQNLTVQALYFLIAIINDVMGSNDIGPHTHLPFVRLLKDHYFAGLAFPLALFVTINFWLLYFTHQEQIAPEIFKNLVPCWLQHFMHSNVTVFMFTEMFICFRSYPPLLDGLSWLLGFVVFYIAWLHVVRYLAGFWVYPILSEKNSKELYQFFGSSILEAILIYMFGELLNNSIWSYELKHQHCAHMNT